MATECSPPLCGAYKWSHALWPSCREPGHQPPSNLMSLWITIHSHRLPMEVLQTPLLHRGTLGKGWDLKGRTPHLPQISGHSSSLSGGSLYSYCLLEGGAYDSPHLFVLLTFDYTYCASWSSGLEPQAISWAGAEPDALPNYCGQVPNS